MCPASKELMLGYLVKAISQTFSHTLKRVCALIAAMW